MNNSEDGSEDGQGTSAEYKITDRHRVSPPGNPTKGNDGDKARRDDGERNETNTGRVLIG